MYSQRFDCFFSLLQSLVSGILVLVEVSLSPPASFEESLNQQPPSGKVAKLDDR
jgi:hypothetical protein